MKKMIVVGIDYSLTYPSNIKFPNLLAYSASAISGATDIITFPDF